jgi:hypothetical protein
VVVESRSGTEGGVGACGTAVKGEDSRAADESSTWACEAVTAWEWERWPAWEGPRSVEPSDWLVDVGGVDVGLGLLWYGPTGRSSAPQS